MSSSEHVDTRPQSPAATPASLPGAFAGLLAILDDYRLLLTDAGAGSGQANGRTNEQLSADLRQVEEQIRDCLHAMGWTHRSENGGPPRARTHAVPRSDTPADAALALAEELHRAEAHSEALLRRLQQGRGPESADLARAALYSHRLLQEALVVGAVELAVRLGVPDGELPD